MTRSRSLVSISIGYAEGGPEDLREAQQRHSELHLATIAELEVFELALRKATAAALKNSGIPVENATFDGHNRILESSALSFLQEARAELSNPAEASTNEVRQTMQMGVLNASEVRKELDICQACGRAPAPKRGPVVR
jgi:hypothetical protein